MVVDLQGVKEESSGEVRYVLTDPAIHCGSVRRFGKTNLGREGMYKFFRTYYIVTAFVKLWHLSFIVSNE
jgi:hypothetical protein